jgi:glutathione S-transferase
MYTLYYAPGSASMAVHLALLEIGAPHRLEKVDLEAGEQHSAAYRKLNPRGQVPTLVIGGKPYFESVGLLMLLAELHPEVRLAPPVGSALQPAWYQWMAFMANSLAPMYRLWFMPKDLGPDELPPVVRDAIRRKIEDSWSLVDVHLGTNGPCMLGAEVSAVDLLTLMYMRWSRNMPKPATDWPALKRFAGLMRRRPSWNKLYEIEGLTEWAE